jgi:hypothetical protein
VNIEHGVQKPVIALLEVRNKGVFAQYCLENLLQKLQEWHTKGGYIYGLKEMNRHWSLTMAFIPFTMQMFGFGN